MKRATVMSIAVALAFTLAGCGSVANDNDKGPKLTKPAVGQCVAKEVPDGDDTAPDFQSVVPCNQPHVYEVVGVHNIPAKFLSGKTKKARLARRTELAATGEKPRTPLNKEYSQDAQARCSDDERKITGLDAVEVNGKSAKAVDLRPSGRGIGPWRNVTSPALWNQGVTQTLCLIRYFDPNNAKTKVIKPIASKDTHTVVSRYLTKDFPEELRACVADDKEGYSSCLNEHQKEALFSLDIKAVYDQHFLDGAKLKDLGSLTFTKIRSACADAYRHAGGTITNIEEMGARTTTGKPKTTGKALMLTCLLVRDSSTSEYF